MYNWRCPFLKSYYKIDPWQVVEEGFEPTYNRITESVMSLGNGYMGCRGNFEEAYSGDTLSGTYIAGIYYPDKTKVGWWKNGYPEYFAKVLNATNFMGIDVTLNGTKLDLHNHPVTQFKRVLNMKDGYLLRSFHVKVDGQSYQIETKRFFSMAKKEIAAFSYSVTPLDDSVTLRIDSYINGDVRNEDSNYDEMFWTPVAWSDSSDASYVVTQTKKTHFQIAVAMKNSLSINDTPSHSGNPLYVSNTFNLNLESNKTVTLYKYVAVTTNRDYQENDLIPKAVEFVKEAADLGFNKLFADHCLSWERLWDESDIIIDGDDSAQQGIRFNIFHLKQTYTGEDSRLNIGPKGFTGEKYGGSTYWDTEAYCVPFFLSTAPEKITKQLLVYRYNHLEKAKENANKLGLRGALYPMVTMNGEECHNEWEITFEEIHRNGAIAYAIFNYVRYTGDKDYLSEYGLEVLVEISRFWASRVNYNPYKDKYMILGVTGPNEYENNVNNNWYTNTLATWTLEYTMDVMNYIKEHHNTRYDLLVNQLNLTEHETEKWKDIIEKMYYPIIEEIGVFAQQDGYMDKELMSVKDLPKDDLPLNKNWSWDRILRSCFIKQADVLQGLYFFSHEYDLETKKRNFDFYESKTVHESSLSPCIHAILGSEIGYYNKAYEMYLRTARLDLDNYNKDTDDGLHITSMAGTWMSVVQGFGGLKIHDDHLSLSPFIPNKWKSYSFRVTFRNRILNVTVNDSNITIKLLKGDDMALLVYDNKVYVTKKDSIVVDR